MWGRRQRLESLEENTISSASLCDGIFWNDFKSGVRTQLESVTVTTKDEIAGENWEKLNKAERYQFLKRTFVLWLEQVWKGCEDAAKDLNRWRKIP